MQSVADTVFVHGAVFDGDSWHPSSAVAVRAGTITAVGREAVGAVTGPGTEIVDLAGGLLLPGFVDAHVHPIEGGLERMRCDLTGGDTRDDYLGLVRRYSAGTSAAWILGGGWQLAAFPGGLPVAGDLDSIVSDRPVYLANRDHHGAWVNSRALEIAGIDAGTPDPPDGRIERDSAGAPTGMLHEGACLLVSRFIPANTDAELHEALLSAQRYLHSFGITGWQDAIVGDYGNHSDTGDVYLDAARTGELTSRVVAALWWDRNRGAEQVDDLVRRRGELRHERFQATSVKVMQDGIPENQTASMLDPYVGATGPDATGHSFLDPAELTAAFVALDRADFQIHVHAIGDRAVRESLDAFEATRAANGPSTNRHHVAHLQVVHPADIPRFAELDVTANLQALWATFEPQMVELNVPILGPIRSAWQYPFGDLRRAGTRLCAGSDWPVSTPDPWQALHVAVNRMLPAGAPDFTPEPFYPKQSLDLATALAAYTRGSAWINHADAAGRIRLGATADLCVTDVDPFSGAPGAIGATRTVSTWIGGRAVFTA